MERSDMTPTPLAAQQSEGKCGLKCPSRGSTEPGWEGRPMALPRRCHAKRTLLLLLATVPCRHGTVRTAAGREGAGGGGSQERGRAGAGRAKPYRAVLDWVTRGVLCLGGAF